MVLASTLYLYFRSVLSKKVSFTVSEVLQVVCRVYRFYLFSMIVSIAVNCIHMPFFFIYIRIVRKNYLFILVVKFVSVFFLEPQYILYIFGLVTGHHLMVL